MYTEREVEILMKDHCTRSDAIRHLETGSIVYEDFEKYFDMYMKEWDPDEEELASYRRMIEEKIPAPGWGVVEHEGKTFYIQYFL